MRPVRRPILDANDNDQGVICVRLSQTFSMNSRIVQQLDRLSAVAREGSADGVAVFRLDAHPCGMRGIASERPKYRGRHGSPSPAVPVTSCGHLHLERTFGSYGRPGIASCRPSSFAVPELGR